MKSTHIAALYLAGGFAGGIGLSALFSADDGQPAASPAAVPVADSRLEQRISRLEQRLDAAVAANAALSSDLERISGLLEGLAADAQVDDGRAGRRVLPDDSVVGLPGDESGTASPGSRFEQARRARERSLAAQLTAAGFSQAEAQNIETRVEELRVEAMQSRYEALRSGEPVLGPLQGIDETAALRAELGDSDYERFLEATGRPTRVMVSGVLASSAAEVAGIQSGDEIVSYGGERVFDVRDLNRVLLEGEPNEPVVVDVVRDGQPIQVVLPRGPLGISSGFGRRGAR